MATKIDLFGVFGIDISENEINSALKKANGTDLDVHIASVGGYLDTGIAIYNSLRQYKRDYPESKMTAYLVGYVASMASYVAMGPFFDRVIAEDNTPFMIHNAWTFAIGDQNELRKEADKLEGLSAPMAMLTSKKMGISQEEAQKLLDDETWFFGQSIVDAGIADEVISGDGLETGKEAASALMLDAKTRMTKKSFGEYAQKVAASIPTPQKHELNNKTNPQEEEMDEKAVMAQGVETERKRIAEIMALKGDYKEHPMAADISGVIDKSIQDGVEKAEVLTRITAVLTSGKALADQDSAPATPQGVAGTASGEQPAEPVAQGEEGF